MSRLKFCPGCGKESTLLRDLESGSPVPVLPRQIIFYECPNCKGRFGMWKEN